MENQDAVNQRDWLAAGLLVAVLTAFLLPMAAIGVDPHHDGVMVKAAQDVASGKVLFRDTFTQYGALTTYLQALTLKLQPTLLALRIATVGLYGLTLLFLYAAWRSILPRALTVVACALFIVFIPAYETDPWNNEHWLLLPWSSAFAMTFQAAGFYALARMIRGERPGLWGLLLGVTTAAVFWCRQPVGILMAGSVMVIWPALHGTGWSPRESTKREILVRLAGGFLGLHGLMLAGIVLSGAWPDWWYQNFIWPARWSQSIIWMDTLSLFVDPVAAGALVLLWLALAAPAILRRYRAAWPVGAYVGYFAVIGLLLAWRHEWLLQLFAAPRADWNFLVPAVTAILAGLAVKEAVVGRKGGLPLETHLIAAMSGVALGAFAQYYPTADTWHIFYSVAPAFGLVVFAAWRWSGAGTRAVAIVFAILLIPAAYAKARLVSPAINRPLVTLTKPALLQGMRVPPDQARNLDQIADTLTLIQKFRPDIPGVLIGNDALYLSYLKNHDNPTAYYVTWMGLADQATNLRRWEYIHRVRPVMILQKPRWQAVDEFYEQARYQPILYVQAEALEIAIPRELAEEMGIRIYGLFGYGRPRPKP